MKVAVALETRFVRTPDGAVWSLGWLDGTFWQRFLDVFEQVKVIARVGEVPEPPARARPADSTGVSFASVPYYVGPWQYAVRYRALRKITSRVVSADEALILRVPGAVGSLVGRTALKRGRPFGLEVVGDPAEVFAGGVRSILAPAARIAATRALQTQCRRASAVAYVSEKTLIGRYPPNPSAFVTEYSTIDLRDEAFVAGPKPYAKRPSPLNVVTVGSLEQLYKGPDVLIRAVDLAFRSLVEMIPDAVPPRLTLIGDGKHRMELEGLARAHGLADRICFTGQLPAGDAVRAELDRADLFVLASRTEGLPRAMIEAMARGLPCIGTNVGGIPELLGAEQLVEPNDIAGLAQKIVQLAMDPERLRRLSEGNLKNAHVYHASVLRPRRRAFYQEIRDRTADWLATYSKTKC